MRLLLDENVPLPLTSTIKTLLRFTHNVVHVIDLDGWSGTNDLSLYDQAAEAGFEIILTNDAKQMQRRLEVEAIARSGLHRIQYPHRRPGLVGVGLAIATVCAALPTVLLELTGATGQQLVFWELRCEVAPLLRRDGDLRPAAGRGRTMRRPSACREEGRWPRERTATSRWSTPSRSM